VLVAHSGKQAGEPWALEAQRFSRMGEEYNMAEDTKVYPTGLTEKEAIEINEGLKWGTRIFGAIAVLAHILAYALTPWLH
jgi:light-harvesting protein B-800-850 beta chain